jgi:hypothetical protein
MNINPKDSKNYHGLTVEEKKELFTAIHSAVKAAKVDYIRMYTEPRMFGYRSKLYLGKVTPAQGEAIAKNITSLLRKTSIGLRIARVRFELQTTSVHRYMHTWNIVNPVFYIDFK